MDLVDASMPLAQDIQEKAEEIEEKWQKFLRKELKPDEFRVLTKEINTFLQGSASNARKLKAQLSDIVLAQDFQDLRSEEHTSELQSRPHLVCRLLLEKKK